VLTGRCDQDDVCSDLNQLGCLMLQLYHQLQRRQLWTLFDRLEAPLSVILGLLELRDLRVNVDVMHRSRDVLQVTVTSAPVNLLVRVLCVSIVPPLYIYSVYKSDYFTLRRSGGGLKRGSCVLCSTGFSDQKYSFWLKF